MVKSTLDQLHQIYGTGEFKDDLSLKWAEVCGGVYDTTTFTTASGSTAVIAGAAFAGSDVGNYILVSDNVYEVTAISGTSLTIGSAAQTTGAAVSGEKRWNKNLQSDLNYIRSQLDNIMGGDTWNDENTCTNLCDMSNLIPKNPNPVGDNSQYPGIRSGIASFLLSNQHTGSVSSGAPGEEYTDDTSTASAGDSLVFTDDTTLAVSIPGGFYPADTGTLNITKDGIVVGTLNLATAFSSDGCSLEQEESDVGTNPNHTSSHTGTDIIDLSSRRCMNDITDGYGSFWPAYQVASMAAVITLVAGYSGVLRIEHTDGNGQSNTLSEFWVDTTSQSITSAAPTISQNTSVTRSLSGIPYYDTGTTFNLSVTSSDALFDRGYVVSPCFISVSQFNASNQTPSYANLGLSTPTSIGDTIGTYTQTPGITVGGGNFRDLDARATVNFEDIFGSQTSGDSSTGTYRIDTYGTTSTDMVRTFDDETYRFIGSENFNNTSIGTGDSSWNSVTSVLTQTDPDGDMGLVIYNGTLKYPTINHSSGFLPVGPDYSSQTGTAVDYELFISSAAFTSGFITFSGWVTALSTIQGASVEVSLRYPNCTDYSNSNTDVWQDLGIDQTIFGGNGCLGAGSSGNSIAFSFGTASSVSYGNRVIMRIRYASDAVTALTGITFSPTI